MRFDFPSTGFFDKATYTSISSIDFIDGSASEHVTVNAGLLWKASRNFWVGAVYRQGPEFHNQVSVLVPSDGTIFFAPGTFHVPDVYGVGVTMKPTDAFTICFDFNRILYSQLTKEFVDIFNVNDNGDLASTKDFHVDDGNAPPYG